MYVQRAGFLDGMPGLILSGLYAYYTAMKYAKFWELTKDKCLTSVSLSGLSSLFGSVVTGTTR